MTNCFKVSVNRVYPWVSHQNILYWCAFIKNVQNLSRIYLREKKIYWPKLKGHLRKLSLKLKISASLILIVVQRPVFQCWTGENKKTSHYKVMRLLWMENYNVFLYMCIMYICIHIWIVRFPSVYSLNIFAIVFFSLTKIIIFGVWQKFAIVVWKGKNI